MNKRIHRKPIFAQSPNSLLAAGLLLSVCIARSAFADNGKSFTLVATEENTKDMSVNLVADTLRDSQIGPTGEYIPVMFGGREIQAPSMAISKEEAINLVNHDSGILDVQHTFLRLAPLASRVLISFETLQEELTNHCWVADDAPNLRAKLRLYVIPPYGPRKHNRWYGVSPTTTFLPQRGLDPPPASLPIAVFEQQNPWIEANGQNSFFTATYDPEHLLDVKTVGVSKAGTKWEGIALNDVDLCLNRKPGKIADGNGDNRAELCYDPDPNWEPWMEWDVSRAVQKWLSEGFNPATYHGFSLYQYPGVTAQDQVRVALEEPGKARSRAMISFASSSGKADCEGVGGLFGGPSQAELVFGNGKCMSADPTDTEMRALKPGKEPVEIPRILEMGVRPEWRPQLVIEATGPSRPCVAQIEFSPRKPDLATQAPSPVDIEFGPVAADGAVKIQQVLVRTSPGITAEVISEGCIPGKVLNGKDRCIQRLAVQGKAVGTAKIAVKVEYLVPGKAEVQSQVRVQKVTVSEDFDGTPDEVENLAPNQDANLDNIPDRLQSNVNTVQNPRGGWLSVATRAGLLVEKLEFPELKPEFKEQAVEFKRGFVGFKVRGVPKGESAVVSIHTPEPFEEFSSFFEFGPTPDNFTPHWFDYKDMGNYGSRLEDGRVELTLYDGALGDVDGVANGEILVLGGMGLAVGAGKKDPRLTDASVASSGALMWLLLGGVGVGASLRGRRRKRST